MSVNYKKIIENDFEEPLYRKKHDEVKEYLRIHGFSDFFTIVNDVGGSDRRMMRLIDQMIYNNELISEGSKFNIVNNNHENREIDYHFILKKMKEISKKRPLPTFLFDQRPVTIKTTIERVKYMINRNDIYQKSIVFLGDDDLTSIALALTNEDVSITVLDVDKRLIDFINEIKKEYHLKINAKVFNVVEELPDELLHKFDVVATDPTPEKIPFTVFMNCAVNLLKGVNSIIYTSIYSSAMDETLSLQKVINQMNLYITDIIPNFTKYKSLYELYSPKDIEFIDKYNIKIDEDSMCFTESLFRMKITNKTKTINIQYQGDNLFGKATKRVINDSNLDIASDDQYLNTIKNDLIHSSDRKFNSK